MMNERNAFACHCWSTGQEIIGSGVTDMSNSLLCKRNVGAKVAVSSQLWSWFSQGRQRLKETEWRTSEMLLACFCQ